MATTVVNQGSIIDECDSLTGWTGADGVATSAPTPIESTNRIELQVSSATKDAYFTISSTSYAAQILMLWFTHRAAVDTLANGGVCVYISDGTNTIAFHVAGSDKALFRHDDGPSEWQCVAFDTDNPPATITTIAGSLGSLNWGAITRIGYRWKTIAKSVGGAVNTFWDIMRRYTAGQGLLITGGTSGVPGNFVDVAAADRAVGNQQAFGCFRQLGVGLFGAQASLNFGATGASTYFSVTGIALVFEARGYNDDKLGLTMIGGTGFTNELRITNSTIKSAESAVAVDFSGTFIDVIDLSGSTIETQGGAVLTGTDAAAIAGHVYDDTVWRGCGEVNLGQCSWLRAQVLASGVAADASAAAWTVNADPNGETDGMKFTKGAAAHHALRFGASAPLTMTLTSVEVSGFHASDGNNDSALYFDDRGSDVTWTVNLSGCTGTFSYKKARAGDTVVIAASVPVKITAKDQANDPIQFVRISMFRISDGLEILNADSDASGITSGSFTGSTPAEIKWRCRKGSSGDSPKYVTQSGVGTITASGFDLLVTMPENTINNA